MDNAGQDLRKLQEAHKLFKDGKYEESEAFYSSLVTSPHVGPLAQSRLGLLYLEKGRNAEAMDLFNSVISAGHQITEAYYGLGVISEKSDPSYARAQYEFALRINPKHRGSLARLQKLQSAMASGTAAQASVPRSQPPQAVPPQSQPPQVAAAAVDSGGFGFYAALKRDTSPISKNPVALIDRLQMTRRPKMTDSPFALIVLAVSLLVLLYFGAFIVFGLARYLPNTPVPVLLSVAAAVSAITYLLLKEATRYELREGLLKVTRGLGKRTKSYELFRVTSVRVDRSPVQRLFNSGTLTLTVEGPGGRAEKVKLVGLARGRDLLRLQDELRNLAQLLRQNPLIKGYIETGSNPEAVAARIDRKSPVNYHGKAANVRHRTEQHGRNPPKQVQIIEFRLQREQGLPTVQVYMAGRRVKGTIKDGDEVVLKGKLPRVGSRYETDRIYNKSANGYVETAGTTLPVYEICFVVIALLVVLVLVIANS